MTITIRPIQNHVDPQVTQVTTRQLAIELAEHLLNPQRDRPVVLITRPKGHVAARFDVAQVSDAVGRLTDVYEMPTGSISWSFTNALSDHPGTECYGGAARVYPVGMEWTQDVYAAPLHLAFSDNDVRGATERLIDDVLSAVAAAGFTTTTGDVQVPLDVSDHSTTVELVRQQDALVKDLAKERRRSSQLEVALKKATERVAGVESALRAQDADLYAFVDAEAQFRHEVYLEWARRIPASDKGSRPMAPYTLGSSFLSSVTAQDRAKTVSVIVEILTGLADESVGRAPHRLRRGSGGSDPIVRREDGSACWRVSLQHNSPQARRLHYWRRADSIELSAVRQHDDMRP